MFKKMLSIMVISVFFLNVGSISASRAQTPDPPPNKPDTQTLRMLEEYVQNTFSNTVKSPTAPEALYSPYLYPYRLAKAQSDECFNGVGQPYSGTVALNCTDSPIYQPGITQPKVNQAYVWGFEKYKEDLWYGTAPNTHCLVYGGLGFTSPITTSSYVCEFGDSQYSPPAPASLGDWRPPNAYLYDTHVGGLPVDKSVIPTNFPNATVADTYRFTSTVGIRSAGLYTSAISNTVFLAGPSLLGAGINLFAYDVDAGGFISSTSLITYTNIRKWINVNGELYTGVAVNPLLGGGGAVLRYIGDPSSPSQIFNFEEVGRMASDAAELVAYNGRLFVSTWPRLSPQVPQRLYMSPLIPPGGLTQANKNGWKPVWSNMNYDPDPITALATGGGAMASFEGWLYWGTMHVPFASYLAHMQVYPPDPNWDDETRITYQLATLLGSHRAISIFRGRNFHTTTPEIELVYGEEQLPAYVDGSWAFVPNYMYQSPLHGSSGFGNFYNNYTWTMGVYKDELYVGTMDWSYLLEDGLEFLLEYLGLPSGTMLPLPGSVPGADLWRFPDSSSSAESINLTGVGNYLNYGIRTMEIDNDELNDDDGMFLGSANPMNLMTDLYDGLPEGGWELIEMREYPPLPDLDVEKSTIYDALPITPGQLFNYTLLVENLGFGDAVNVTLEDTLLPEVAYVSDDRGCSYDPGDHVVTCNLGNLDGYDGSTYDSTTLVISVTAPSDPIWMVNKARVWNDTGDADYDNNETYLLNLVDEPTDLQILKTASHEAVLAGQALTYILTIINAGPGEFVSSVPLTIRQPEYIHIPTLGVAFPYPSDMLELDGLHGKVAKVTVTLNGLTHTRTSDLDIILVSPNETKVMLMSDAGGGFNFNTDLQLTFDDEALDYLPENTGIISGTYKPTDYSLFPDIFPPPAPLGPVEDELSAFNGEDPNGNWQLYVLDDMLGYSGYINDGWTLGLVLERQATVSDPLPEEVQLDGWHSNDWDCDEEDPGDVTCVTTYLPLNSPTTIDLFTTVLFSPNWTITNTATVTSDTYDPVLDNNTSTIVINAFKWWFPFVLSR